MSTSNSLFLYPHNHTFMYAFSNTMHTQQFAINFIGTCIAQPQCGTKCWSQLWWGGKLCSICTVRHPTRIGTHSLAWRSYKPHHALCQVWLSVQWLPNHLLQGCTSRTTNKRIGIHLQRAALRNSNGRGIPKGVGCLLVLPIANEWSRIGAAILHGMHEQWWSYKAAVSWALLPIYTRCIEESRVFDITGCRSTDNEGTDVWLGDTSACTNNCGT